MADGVDFTGFPESHIGRLQDVINAEDAAMQEIWGQSFDPTTGEYGDYLGHRSGQAMNVMLDAYTGMRSAARETYLAVAEVMRDAGNPAELAIYGFNDGMRPVAEVAEFWRQPVFAGTGLAEAFLCGLDYTTYTDAMHAGSKAGWGILDSYSSTEDARMLLQTAYAYDIARGLNRQHADPKFLEDYSLEELAARAILTVEGPLLLQSVSITDVNLAATVQRVDDMADSPEVREYMRQFLNERVEKTVIASPSLDNFRMAEKLAYGDEVPAILDRVAKAHREAIAKILPLLDTRISESQAYIDTYRHKRKVNDDRPYHEEAIANVTQTRDSLVEYLTLLDARMMAPLAELGGVIINDTGEASETPQI